jgi:hypothetical protein
LQALARPGGRQAPAAWGSRLTSQAGWSGLVLFFSFFFIKKNCTRPDKVGVSADKARTGGCFCFYFILFFYFYLFFFFGRSSRREERGTSWGQLVLCNGFIFLFYFIYLFIIWVGLIVFFVCTCKSQGLGSSHGWGDSP